MAKVFLRNSDGVLLFRCPACNRNHGFPLLHKGHNGSPVWTWNESKERPTVQPMARTTKRITLSNTTTEEKVTPSRCEYRLEDRYIVYGPHCDHAYSDQKLELLEWDRRFYSGSK